MDPFHFLSSDAARGQRRSDGRQPPPALAAQLGRLPRGPVIYDAVRRYTVFSPRITEGHRVVWDAFISPTLSHPKQERSSPAARSSV